MVQTKPPINTSCTSSAHCDRQQKKRSPSNEVAHLWRCLHKKRSCWGSSFGVHLWQKPSKNFFLKTGSLLCVCCKRRQQTSRRRVVESAAAAFAAGPKQVFRPQQPPDQTAFAPMQIAHTQIITLPVILRRLRRLSPSPQCSIAHKNMNFTRVPVDVAFFAASVSPWFYPNALMCTNIIKQSCCNC